MEFLEAGRQTWSVTFFGIALIYAATTSRTLFGIKLDTCSQSTLFRLTDRNLEPNNVASLGLDALLLIPNALPFNLTDSDQTDSGHSLHEQLLALQRPQTIRIMLSKSLAENPKTLLIVDDVYLQETVDLFANLRVCL